MKPQITLLFFASLAEDLNCRELQLDWSPEWQQVSHVRDHLCARGGVWLSLGSDRVRCAVNHEIARMDHPVQPGDEVAFFPPVTGG